MIHLRTFVLFAAALLLCAVFGSGDVRGAPRPRVRLVDPVSQPLNRKAFEDRVNDLSGAIDAIDGGSSATTQIKTGTVTIAAGAPTSAWMDLWRFAPGLSKRGAMSVQIIGDSTGSSGASVVRVDDRFEWSTNGSGIVFVQGYAGHSQSIGDPGCPATPTAPSATVGADSITVGWTSVPTALGYEILYSVDAGATYHLALPRAQRTDVSFVFKGHVAPSSAVKLKVRAYNDVGFSFDSPATDATTGAGHWSQTPCVDAASGYDTIPCIQRQLAPAIVPSIAIIWDDLQEHVQGSPPGSNLGGVQIRCEKDPLITTDLVCRARTQSTRSATLRYKLQNTPR